MALLGAGLLLALAGCATPSGSQDEAQATAPLVVRTTDSSGTVTQTRVVPPPPPTPRRRSAPPSPQPEASDRGTVDTAEAAGTERVMLNFVDADLAGVVRSLARFTQRNFLVDPRVKGTLTLVSETPVDARTAYDMLLGALRMQGFAVVEVDGVNRVVPEADAKLHGGAVTGTDPSAAGSAEVVTRVFQLRFENAANLIPVLRPMIAPNNTISAYPGNNTLVISDYADNLARIAEVIERIDVPSSFNTDIVPIEYGVALDVAALANQLLQGGRPGDQGSQSIALVADPRSNSIIIRAPSQAQLDLARDLVIRIDSPDSGAGNLHVVYLRNAQATHLAEVLRGVLTGQGSHQGAQAGGLGLPAGSPFGVATTGAAASVTGTSTSGTRSTQAGLPGTGTLPGAGMPGTALAGPAGGSAGQTVAFSAGGATIQADASTNTLIISAPDPLYRNLRTVIDQLDQRRAQVLVESLIVEVTAENMAEFGIQWSAGGGDINSGNAAFIGGVNFGGSSLATGTPRTTIDAIGRGLSAGMVKGTVTVLGNEVINLGVLARALQSQGGVNILSTPNLMTLDNEEASIMVGRTVPFTTGRYITSGDGAGANPFQTIEREDVGLTLRIRPQISEGGAVKMALYQEVSSVDPATLATNDLITRKRALSTNVLVDDGQIIVLGGLIEDNVSNVDSSVPLLGDIPLLGELFRHNKRTRTKTNLMVFLRPHIVRSARDSASLTLDRYNYMRDTQAALPSGSHWLLPAIDQPLMPAATRRAEDGLIDLRQPNAGAQVPIETFTESAADSGQPPADGASSTGESAQP